MIHLPSPLLPPAPTEVLLPKKGVSPCPPEEVLPSSLWRFTPLPAVSLPSPTLPPAPLPFLRFAAESGKRLEEGRALSDYGVRRESMIFMLSRFLGGMQDGGDVQIANLKHSTRTGGSSEDDLHRGVMGLV